MDEISGLIIKMTEFFAGDPKRIQHFIKVHTFARVIGRAEGLDIRTMYCLDVASAVHDIGISLRRRDTERVTAEANCRSS